MKITSIPGIGPAHAAKLAAVGIRTTNALLSRGATPADRRRLARASGISESLILAWVNLADLYRIKGVGSEYSDLLAGAGVDTTVELAKRVPDNLHERMEEINKAKKVVQKMPGRRRVRYWVVQAKRLPRVVQY